MGTDIHMRAEFRPNHAAEWAPVTGFQYNARTYGVFAALAGVRSRYPLAPIAPARGLPADLAIGHAMFADWARSGGHDASWVELREVMSYDWAPVPDADQFLTECRKLAVRAGEQPVRLVFWFDS